MELKSLLPHNQFSINHHHHKSQYINQIINHNNTKPHIKPHINHNNHKVSISLNKNIFHKSLSQLFHNNNNKWTMLHNNQWFNNNNNNKTKLLLLMKKLIKFWLCYNKDNMDMICWICNIINAVFVTNHITMVNKSHIYHANTFITQDVLLDG